jgi:hypothetical protein
MKQKKSVSEWRKIFEAWKASGQTRSEFCQERSIPVSTFDYWKKRLKAGKGATSRFVQVRHGVKSIDKSAKIRIIVDDRYSVELNAGFEADDLITILRAMRAV